MPLVLATIAVLAIIYLVPMAVYGAASGLGLVELPAEASPRTFLLGILVTKLGTAVAFVLILALSGAMWSERWLLYGVIWLAMFAASELGDAISGRSSWPEAVLGIVSEAIYAPAAAFAAHQTLGLG